MSVCSVERLVCGGVFGVGGRGGYMGYTCIGLQQKIYSASRNVTCTCILTECRE